MKGMSLTKIYLPLAGVILFCQQGFLEADADQEGPVLAFKSKSKTSWTVPDKGDARGLAFDGKYYYVGIYTEGLIRKYDLDGTLVDTIGKNDTHHPFLGHGVATDGKYLWTSDYSVDRKVYKFDITANKEVGSWTVPMEGNPVRLAYDGKNLWITVYDVPRVFKVSTEGKLLGSFPIARSDVSTGIAADVKGSIFVSSTLTGQLKLCSAAHRIPGTVLKLYNVFPPSTVLATDFSNRSSGLYQLNASGQIEFFEIGNDSGSAPAQDDPDEILTNVKFDLPSHASAIAINSNGNITIDGEPFFPLGMYSCLGIDSSSGDLVKGDLPLTEKRIRSWFDGIELAGFNMIQTYALCHYAQTDPQRLAPLEKRQQGRKLFLDYAQNSGLKVMIWLHEGYPDFRTLLPDFPDDPPVVARQKAWEVRKKEIISSIETLGNHPALLVWNLADEPPPSSQQTELLERHYKFAKSLDTVHPIYVVNWEEDSIRSQSKGCDIMAEDMYPIGAPYGGAGGPNQPKGHWPAMAEIAQWQDWILDTQADGRPVAWGVVQIHRRPGPEATLRIPTFEEMRVMTFMRLVKDVKGLFFFAFNMDRERPYMETHPAHWENVSNTVKSVHTVLPAMFSSETVEGYEVSDKRVFSIMKKVKQGRDSYYYLLAVNPICQNRIPPEDYPVALGRVTFSNITVGRRASVTVLDEDPSGKFKLGSRRKIDLRGTRDSKNFSDNFGKLAVHSYKIGPIE